VATGAGSKVGRRRFHVVGIVPALHIAALGRQTE